MSAQSSKDSVYGMLSDVDIKRYLQDGTIKITSSAIESNGFNIDQVKLGSIDLHFRKQIMRFDTSTNSPITYIDRDYANSCDVKNGKLIIQPNEVVLATTQESVNLPNNFAGIITGRSSIARLGIMVHCCQEFINPGHGQSIPLQIINLSPRAVELQLNVPICQLVLFKMHTPASQAYKQNTDAKYSKETTPLPSAIHKEVKASSEEVVSDTEDETQDTNATLFSQRNKALRKKFQKLFPFIKDLLLIFVTSYICNSPVVKAIFEEGISFKEFFTTLTGYPGGATILIVIILLVVIARIYLSDNGKGE